MSDKVLNNEAHRECRCFSVYIGAAVAVGDQMGRAENPGVIRAVRRAAVTRRVVIYGINYAPEPTGVGRYTGEIGAYLAARGLDVTVVTAVPHYPGWHVRPGYRNRYHVERMHDVKVWRCPLFMKANMRGVWRVIAPVTFALASAPVAICRILVTRPDTLLCVEPTLFSAPVALLAAKLVGARTVLHVQDLEIDAAFVVGHLKGRLLRKIANTFECAIIRRFDSVVTISSRMMEHLRLKGVHPERLAIVRNWVDTKKIRPLHTFSSYRAELNIPDENFVVLYAGNVGPKQALPVLLNAAESLANERSITFVVAGDGSEKSKLQMRYGHLQNIKFLPVQPEERLGELLNLADVHVLPQQPGTADLVLPSKLGGMLASGKHCIVMADPGTELHDFLSGAVALIPSGDVGELTRAIKLVMNSAPDDGLDARLRLAECFGSDVNIPTLFRLICGQDNWSRDPQPIGAG